jgi:hypothetical protein
MFSALSSAASAAGSAAGSASSLLSTSVASVAPSQVYCSNANEASYAETCKKNISLETFYGAKTSSNQCKMCVKLFCTSCAKKTSFKTPGGYYTIVHTYTIHPIHAIYPIHLIHSIHTIHTYNTLCHALPPEAFSTHNSNPHPPQQRGQRKWTIRTSFYVVLVKQRPRSKR